MSEDNIETTHPEFLWYELVSSDVMFQQGDIIRDFPIPEPPIEIYSREFFLVEGNTSILGAEIKKYDVIVMTQSCDFIKFKPDNAVNLCPIYDLKIAIKPNGQSLSNPDSWDKLRKGMLVHSHLLNQCEISGYKFDYKVVDLHRVLSVPFRVLQVIQSSMVSDENTINRFRVRLLPPYREHLAQAFARQFMRVGLPQDLPEKFPYK